MNAVTEQTVVENPRTYKIGNTTALVVAATIDEIANRATRRSRMLRRSRWRRSAITSSGV
jgi:hypothetical protein